jgi:hypothetical protein
LRSTLPIDRNRTSSGTLRAKKLLLTNLITYLICESAQSKLILNVFPLKARQVLTTQNRPRWIDFLFPHQKVTELHLPDELQLSV